MSIIDLCTSLAVMIAVVALIFEAEDILLRWRCMWHNSKVDRTQLVVTGAAATRSIQNIITCHPSLSMAVRSLPGDSPESNTLNPLPTLHSSLWCIHSLHKVSMQDLLTPGWGDSFAHPTCSPPAVDQHFTPIPLRPPSVVCTDWMASSGSFALTRSHISHLRPVFCGLSKCHSYHLLILGLFPQLCPSMLVTT